MGKPSMFSENYDKQMRRRRRIKALLIIVAVVGIIFTIIHFTTKNDNKTTRDKNKQETKVEDKKKQDTKKDVEQNKKPQVNNEQKPETKPVNEVKEESIKLSNNEEVKVKYNLVNNKRQYTEVMAKNVEYSISPSKKHLLYLDKSSQSLILVDEDGNKNDITNKQYTSSKGKVFSKEVVLKSNPQYIWNTSPKFADDNTIIYLSQLPWFNKGENKYVWKYTISTGTHEYLVNKGGSQITYGNVSEAGLEVIIDGEVNIVK